MRIAFPSATLCLVFMVIQPSLVVAAPEIDPAQPGLEALANSEDRAPGFGTESEDRGGSSRTSSVPSGWSAPALTVSESLTLGTSVTGGLLDAFAVGATIAAGAIMSSDGRQPGFVWLTVGLATAVGAGIVDPAGLTALHLQRQRSGYRIDWAPLIASWSITGVAALLGGISLLFDWGWALAIAAVALEVCVGWPVRTFWWGLAIAGAEPSEGDRPIQIE